MIDSPDFEMITNFSMHKTKQSSVSIKAKERVNSGAILIKKMSSMRGKALDESNN